MAKKYEITLRPEDGKTALAQIAAVKDEASACRSAAECFALANSAASRGLVSNIAAGIALLEARETATHGEWATMVAKHWKHGPSWATRCMSVAREFLKLTSDRDRERYLQQSFRKAIGVGANRARVHDLPDGAETSDKPRIIDVAATVRDVPPSAAAETKPTRPCPRCKRPLAVTGIWIPNHSRLESGEQCAAYGESWPTPPGTSPSGKPLKWTRTDSPAAAASPPPPSASPPTADAPDYVPRCAACKEPVAATAEGVAVRHAGSDGETCPGSGQAFAPAATPGAAPPFAMVAAPPEDLKPAQRAPKLWTEFGTKFLMCSWCGARQTKDGVLVNGKLTGQIEPDRPTHCPDCPVMTRRGRVRAALSLAVRLVCPRCQWAPRQDATFDTVDDPDLAHYLGLLQDHWKAHPGHHPAADEDDDEGQDDAAMPDVQGQATSHDDDEEDEEDEDQEALPDEDDDAPDEDQDAPGETVDDYVDPDPKDGARETLEGRPLDVDAICTLLYDGDPYCPLNSKLLGDQVSHEQHVLALLRSVWAQVDFKLAHKQLKNAEGRQLLAKLRDRLSDVLTMAEELVLRRHRPGAVRA